MRTANRAGIRLGVKTAVRRISVLRLALRTHGECLHRSVRAIVGQRLDDAETRAAMGAVCERIAVTTIFRVEHFTEALRARGNVRQHQRRLVTAGPALTDFKAGIANRIKPRSFKTLDETARWFFGFEAE